LTNSIVDMDRICRPLEIAVQNALLNKGFVNLRSELPSDFVSCEEDVKEIIDIYFIDVLKKQPNLYKSFEDGTTIVNGVIACFFSADMITVSKKLLVPLIEEYSKHRAKEIVDDQISKNGVPLSMVPLSLVVKEVGDKFPDLFDCQHQHNIEYNVDDNNIELSWDTEYGACDGDGPLVDFCRCTLFSEELQRMCTRSVKAEVERLTSTRLGFSIISRPEGAAKILNIGDSFESSFRVLCHLLQLFSKSLDTLGSRTQQSETDFKMRAMVNDMKEELLLGCGSCLARLITEYYLFKNTDTDTHSLYFESHCGLELERNSMLENCDATRLDRLNFPVFVLKCQSESNMSQCPIQHLRSVFPGSAGKNLAQMWMICSKNNDNQEEDDHDSEDAYKKLQLFILFLVMNCLNLVGIPFAILDKKTEQKLTAARREGILDCLERSVDRDEIAACAIVLLSNTVKNVSIVGNKSIDLALNFLDNDSKVPNKFVEAITALRDSATNDDTIDSLICLVKKLGSAKNVKALVAIS
jgi:hypothetical protein